MPGAHPPAMEVMGAGKQRGRSQERGSLVQKFKYSGFTSLSGHTTLASNLFPGVTDKQTPSHGTHTSWGMCPNCLCPFPAPIGQWGTDLESVWQSCINGLLTLFSLPFLPFL